VIDEGDMVVTTVDDALVRDRQVLVLVGSEVMLLSPVSSEIVRVCAGGLSVGELGEHLLAEFGPPPAGNSVHEQTRIMVERLREAGVVRVTSAIPPSISM
jgi:hypothetical protein